MRRSAVGVMPGSLPVSPISRGARWDGPSPWPSPQLAWQPLGTRPTHTYRHEVMKDRVCQRPLTCPSGPGIRDQWLPSSERR